MQCPNGHTSEMEYITSGSVGGLEVSTWCCPECGECVNCIRHGEFVSDEDYTMILEDR